MGIHSEAASRAGGFQRRRSKCRRNGLTLVLALSIDDDMYGL